MSLLSFRTPVQISACSHCGNALSLGEEECPNCGTNQRRALMAPNSVVFNNHHYMVPRRMLVSYPSVPEEVNTAWNIARARARVMRRIAFGVATSAMLAGALTIAYGPGLRSPAVMRLAARPEPVPAPPIDITKPLDETEETPQLASVTAPGSGTAPDTPAIVVAATASPPVPASITQQKSVEPAVVAQTKAPAEPPALVAQTPVVQAVEPKPMVMAQVQTAVQTAPVPDVTAPVVTETPKPVVIAQTQTQPVATLATARPFAFDPKAAAASASAVSTTVASLSATSGQLLSMLTLAGHTLSAKALEMKQTIADTISARPDAPPPVAIARITPKESVPTPAADVAVPSHATLPAAATVAMDLPPPAEAPMVTTDRPAAGTPAEGIYLAKLALSTSDLSAARKSLATLPAGMADDADLQQLRQDLTRREGARDAAMLRARSCDMTGALQCARRSAKEALVLDTSYSDSKLFLRHVSYEIAQAKRATETASPVQMANAPVQTGVVRAPAKEAQVAARLAEKEKESMPVAPMATAVVESRPLGESRLRSAPITHPAPPRDTRDAREIREARIALDILEARDARAPVRTVTPPAIDPNVSFDAEPIRPAGRGEAH